MKIIGLCGGSGSGKGTLADMLSAAGFLHVDADAVYHEITSNDTPCLRAMAEAFGENIISPSGSLDRRALSAIVFAEGGKEKLLLLNSITHRYVLEEIRHRISMAEGDYIGAVVDAPLLFESGFDAECGFIVAVLAPYEVRLARIMARDGLPEERARARLNASHSDDFFREKSHAVLVNDGRIPPPEAEVDRLLNEWGVRP